MLPWSAHRIYPGHSRFEADLDADFTPTGHAQGMQGVSGTSGRPQLATIKPHGKSVSENVLYKETCVRFPRKKKNGWGRTTVGTARAVSRGKCKRVLYEKNLWVVRISKAQHPQQSNKAQQHPRP